MIFGAQIDIKQQKNNKFIKYKSIISWECEHLVNVYCKLGMT